MKICNIGKIITAKIDGTNLTRDNYISTENMLSNCGGVVASSSVPSTKVTRFSKHDVLLSNIRPYFKKVWFARFDGGCSNDVICIRANEKDCLSQYLYYAISTDRFIDSFSASSKGTKMPRGDKNALLSYEIRDRTIDEQQHIVDILGSIDNSIENNEKEIKKINDFALLLISQTGNKKTALKPYIKFIKGKKPVQNGTEKSDYLSIEGITSSIYEQAFVDGMIMATAFDVLMVMDGASSGTVFSHQNGIVSSTLAKIDTPADMNDYIYWFLLSMKDTIKTRNTGSAIPHANKDYISSLMIDVGMATNDVLREKLHTLRERIISLSLENIKLRELKQLYLKKFFG